MGTKTKTITSISLVATLLFFFGIYGAYKARDFLAGPGIAFSSVSNGQTVDRSDIKIIGKVSNMANLFINGRKILPDRDGNFETEMLLAAGYNIIEARGEDKFGRETKKLLEIIYRQ
ncbi:MAG: hypothetical protein Q8Q21_00280 [bacterium]|nr:hypothetical protein [bacterium]